MEKTYQRKEARTNTALSTTYKSLGLNLISASIFSCLSVYLNVPVINWVFVLVICMILLFVVRKNADGIIGVFMTFIFTGWIGFTLGPIISYYLNMPDGAAVVSQSLVGAATIFIVLSGWVYFSFVMYLSLFLTR